VCQATGLGWAFTGAPCVALVPTNTGEKQHWALHLLRFLLLLPPQGRSRAFQSGVLGSKDWKPSGRATGGWPTLGPSGRWPCCWFCPPCSPLETNSVWGN